jgi:hypothetical protein
MFLIATVEKVDPRTRYIVRTFVTTLFLISVNRKFISVFSFLSYLKSHNMILTGVQVNSVNGRGSTVVSAIRVLELRGRSSEQHQVLVPQRLARKYCKGKGIKAYKQS